ncbi:zinc-binding alcohol dehydrogenase family protein [Formicincola oecophyllae]|nr:zinc-binding alcohol dehydrogenase family protein [Formicincola oecophyllae]
MTIPPFMEVVAARPNDFAWQRQAVPKPQGRELLVAVKAVSVNPVDVKIRSTLQPGEERVLGWDASGVVVATGPEVKDFAPGDEVYYAGALQNPGTDAPYQLVDERLVALKPTTLDWAQAAALPLTSLTAWEMLFKRFQIPQKADDTQSQLGKGADGPVLLVIGGAGGVGSMAIQLAKALTNARVVATASRPASRAWAEAMGADHVIDHTHPLKPQLDGLSLPAPTYVFSTSHTAEYLPQIVGLIQPEGQIGLIDDPKALDVVSLKRKSLALHWEWMFTPAYYHLPSMARQGKILAQVAQLVDQGKVRTTLNDLLGPLDPGSLAQAHTMLESGRTVGKIVLEGFANP